MGLQNSRISCSLDFCLNNYVTRSMKRGIKPFTLPETNIAHENPPSFLVNPIKMVDFPWAMLVSGRVMQHFQSSKIENGFFSQISSSKVSTLVQKACCMNVPPFICLPKKKLGKQKNTCFPTPFWVDIRNPPHFRYSKP